MCVRVHPSRGRQGDGRTIGDRQVGGRSGRSPLTTLDVQRSLPDNAVVLRRPANEFQLAGSMTWGEVPPALDDAIVATLADAPLRRYLTLLDIELGLAEALEFFAATRSPY